MVEARAHSSASLRGKFFAQEGPPGAHFTQICSPQEKPKQFCLKDLARIIFSSYNIQDSMGLLIFCATKTKFIGLSLWYIALLMSSQKYLLTAQT